MVSNKVVGREYYLEFLRKKNNCIIVGAKHLGKSSLLKSYCSKEEGVYADLEKIPMVPEDFAVRFIGVIASHLIGGKYNSISDLLAVKEKLYPGIIDAVWNELQKIKPDHELLLKLALRFPESMGKKRLTVCVDEFHNLLDMDNFSGVKDVMMLFKEEVKTYSHCRFILSSSAVSLSKEINKKLEFDLEEISVLDKESVKKIAGDKWQDVYAYSLGFPYYADVLKNYDNVKEGFVKEVLDEKALLHNALRMKVEDALSRARGRGLLNSILLVLASSEGMRLNEISQKIYRSSPVTKSLISRLMEVDLVIKEGNRFRICDNVVRYYIANVWNDVSLEDALHSEVRL